MSCQNDRHRRALRLAVAVLSYPAAMPRTTRRLDCPSCHRPVYSNHRCPGPRRHPDPDEPPTFPPSHATLMLMVEQARQQARHDAHPPEQLELEL